MNIFSLFYKYITDALLVADFTITSDLHFTVEVPHNPQNGDLSTNVAMVIANQMKKRPKEIAELLYPHIAMLLGVKSVEIAGPGFINIYLTDAFWQNFLKQTYVLGNVYGDSKMGENQVINIEFCSANPTGPMHVGHARSAIYGDALANLLKRCGFRVIKEYYINDAGKQIETLAHSLFIRYQQRIGHKIELEENCYPGEYLIEIANNLYSEYGDGLNDGDELIKKFTLDKIMLMIKQDLKDIGVIHDKFTSEKSDILDKGMVEETLFKLNDLGLLYSGVLDAPKSKTPEDWEVKEQTIFKASLFGDEIDRAIVRSDGSYTYFAHDAAYHLDKLNRGFKSMLLLLGADHGGYTKRIKAVVSALSNNKAQIHVIINQLVNLIKDGKPFKMSKRAGNFLTVQDILSEIDKDLLRFAMLSRKNDTVLDLDFNKMKEQSKDNHIFYIQYALSRANSLINRASLLGIKLDCETANLGRLSGDHDLALIKKIALFPKVIESAARSYEIFRVPYYLYDLATTFHQMWGYGNHNSSFKFILEDDLDLSAARLVLIKTMMSTIIAGLDVIGIEPVFEM